VLRFDFCDSFCVFGLPHATDHGGLAVGRGIVLAIPYLVRRTLRHFSRAYAVT
jgi:hypothetical protein